MSSRSVKDDHTKHMHCFAEQKRQAFYKKNNAEDILWAKEVFLFIPACICACTWVCNICSSFVWPCSELECDVYYEPEYIIRNRMPGLLLTSFATPSSSLYPRFSKISCIAVRSVLEQASPRGVNTDVDAEDEVSWEIPIKTWDGTCQVPLNHMIS